MGKEDKSFFFFKGKQVMQIIEKQVQIKIS